MRLITHGISRWVILTRTRAYKFPSLSSWRQFLMGFLANMQEALWWRHGTPDHRERLCPVIWSWPGGLLVAMPRANELAWEEPVDWQYFAELPLDPKNDNVGLLNGRLVLLDYGH